MSKCQAKLNRRKVQSVMPHTLCCWQQATRSPAAQASAAWMPDNMEDATEMQAKGKSRIKRDKKGRQTTVRAAKNRASDLPACTAELLIPKSMST